MYIIISTTGMPLSWFLRTIGKHPGSHCALMNKNGIILHAKPLGVEMDWWEHFVVNNKIVRIYEFTGIDEMIMENAFWTLRHKYAKTGKYDFKALVWFPYMLWKLSDMSREEIEGHIKGKKNAWEDPNRFVCTEVQGDFFNILISQGIELFNESVKWCSSSLTIKHLDELMDLSEYTIRRQPDGISFASNYGR